MPTPNTNPLGYQGLKERDPPDIWFRDRQPLTTDYALYDLLDLWQNTVAKDIWILVSKEAQIATWIQLVSGSGGGVITNINNVFSVGGLLNLANLGGLVIAPPDPPAQPAGTIGLGANVDGVTITINGSNQLVATAGGGGIGITSWVETAISLLMTVNTGYVANGAGLLTLTLPAVAPFGTEQEITGKGAGLWQLAANAGQTIHFNSVAGTNVACFGQFDSIRVVCTTANTVWNVLSDEGNFTIT